MLGRIPSGRSGAGLPTTWEGAARMAKGALLGRGGAPKVLLQRRNSREHQHRQEREEDTDRRRQQYVVQGAAAVCDELASLGAPQVGGERAHALHYASSILAAGRKDGCEAADGWDFQAF